MASEDDAPKGYQNVNFPLRYRMFLTGPFKIQESFVNECLQKIYHSGRLSGTRLLDFASGPVVHRIASASLQFNDIVLAEFAEANRKEVEKWLRGDKNALDWSPLLEQCVRAEGFKDLDEGLAEIERRIRKTVKQVVPCDALAEEILPKGLGEFDVISMSRCLETCCSTIEMYKDALKKLIKYLQKGGALVTVSALEAELTQAQNTVPCIYLTEEIIKETLVETGLELRDWFCWRDTEKHEIFKYGRVSGTRLLDFGCGPVITKIASASLQFQEIVLSDVSAPCRDELEKWLREDKDALDCTPFLEKCAWAEGFRNLDEGVSEIEKRIRGAVKKVVFCDVLADNILPDGLGEFDVISLNRCLESCCSTIEMYTEALKKLTKHLKKGGALVMVSVLEAQSYTAHKTFKALYLTEKSIKEALVEAGLDLRDWICWINSRKYESATNSGFSVHYSIKL